MDFYNPTAVESCRDLNFTGTLEVDFSSFFNLCHP